MSKDVYESPLSSRYASPYMLHLFSADMRFQTWRRLWTALARAEHELGLPITAGQVAELEAHITDIDYAVAEQREREVRHDVMAHVYAYGKAAPSAAGIIHLGATSCYVTDNADLILYRDGLRYLRGELLGVLANLAATHQVIVVTHLAQVAVMADKHYVVSKEPGDVPQTHLGEVTGEARTAEIARMLSGDQSEASLAHAKQMLEEARG